MFPVLGPQLLTASPIFQGSRRLEKRCMPKNMNKVFDPISLASFFSNAHRMFFEYYLLGQGGKGCNQAVMVRSFPLIVWSVFFPCLTRKKKKKKIDFFF